MTRERKGLFAACSLALVAFAYFAHHRVAYVGGSDSASYLVESLRLRGVDAGLAPDPSLHFADAFVPLGMTKHGGIVHSSYPPGLSILLALAGLLHLEFFVTPLVGALGGLALFGVIRARARVHDGVALALMLAWYAAPMTFWGSTQVMSDYVAASFVIATVLAIERNRALVAGLLIGFAVGIRPTCILVVPALVVFLASRSRRSWALALVGVTVAGVGWLLFIRLSFGSFDMPYVSHNLTEMRGENFLRQAMFLLAETARQHVPIVLLAFVGIVRSPRECVPYVLWFAPFVFVHSLWRPPYDAWWHVRFLASSYPALFIAAAVGIRSIPPLSTLLANRIAQGAGVVVLVAYAVSWAVAPETAPLRTHRFDEFYALDTRRVLELVPRDSLIGAREHTSAFRLYGRLQTFQWCHPDTPALMKAAFERHRAVYAVFMFDDDNGCPAQSAVYRAGLDVEEVARLPSNSRLVRLAPRTTE